MVPKKMWKFPTKKKTWVSSWGVENMNGGMGHMNHMNIPWVQFLMGCTWGSLRGPSWGNFHGGWTSSPCPVFEPISGFESPYFLKNTPKKNMLGLNHHVKKKKNVVSGSRLLTLEGSNPQRLLFGNSAFLISYECAFPASNHGLLDGWPIRFCSTQPHHLWTSTKQQDISSKDRVLCFSMMNLWFRHHPPI